MGLLLNLFEKRASTVNPIHPRDPALGELFGGSTSIAGPQITESNALSISVVWACVQIIAETLASLPFFPYRRIADGREIATDHPLYRVLHQQTNSMGMTPMDFRQTLTAHILTWGNAFAEIVRNSAGAVTELYPLLPSRMRLQTFNGKLFYYVRAEDGKEIQLRADQVLHIRGLGNDGMVGYSVISKHRETLGLTKAEEEYRARFFSNDARPGGVLQHPGRLSDDAYNRLKKSWADAHAGTENKHKPAILEENMQWKDVGIPPKDAEFIAGRTFQIQEVARIFRVPLVLLQEHEKSTSWGCLPGDTLVFTDQGPKPIEQIKPGDSVWSLGEEGMVRATVSATRMTGIKNYLSIETNGRVVRPTGNHKMLVRRFQPVGKGHESKGWINMWITADQVRVGDYLPVPHGLAGANGDHAPNGQLLTVGIMELCGYYTGNGSVDAINRVELSHAVGADCMAHYRRVITDELGVDANLDSRGHRTRFSSKEFRALLECGFLGECLTKRVPVWIFTLRRDLQLGFLRGYLDSDGSVQRGRIIYTSANRALLEDVRHLCIQAGIPVGLVCVGRKAGKCTIQGRTYDAQPKYQLSLSTLSFNSEIGSNSASKQARFTVKKNQRRYRYDSDYDSGMGGSEKRKLTFGWPFSDVKLHRVKRITESEIAVPVYDISVEGTETFIADGVLVHNSGIEQFMLGFVVQTLRSWAVRWEQQCNIALLTESERQIYYMEHKFEALLRGDAKTQADSLAVMRQNGALNADEWRQLLNMNPIPDGSGKTYWRPANMAPADAPFEITPAQ